MSNLSSHIEYNAVAHARNEDEAWEYHDRKVRLAEQMIEQGGKFDPLTTEAMSRLDDWMFAVPYSEKRYDDFNAEIIRLLKSGISINAYLLRMLRYTSYQAALEDAEIEIIKQDEEAANDH